MKIQVAWDDDEHTTIYFLFTQKWTWDEAGAAIQAARALMASVQHPVDMIVDMRVPFYPSNYADNVRDINSSVSLQTRLVVLIRHGLMAELFQSIASRYERPRFDFAFADNLDHARQIIADYRVNGGSRWTPPGPN